MENLKNTIISLETTHETYAFEAQSFIAVLRSATASFERISSEIARSKTELATVVQHRDQRMEIRDALFRITELPSRLSLLRQIAAMEKNIKDIRTLIQQEHALRSVKQKQVSLLLHSTSMIQQTVGLFDSLPSINTIHSLVDSLSTDIKARTDINIPESPSGREIDLIMEDNEFKTESTARKRALQQKFHNPRAQATFDAISALNLDPSEAAVIWSHLGGLISPKSVDGKRFKTDATPSTCSSLCISKSFEEELIRAMGDTVDLGIDTGAAGRARFSIIPETTLNPLDGASAITETAIEESGTTATATDENDGVFEGVGGRSSSSEKDKKGKQLSKQGKQSKATQEDTLEDIHDTDEEGILENEEDEDHFDIHDDGLLDHQDEDEDIRDHDEFNDYTELDEDEYNSPDEGHHRETTNDTDSMTT